MNRKARRSYGVWGGLLGASLVLLAGCALFNITPVARITVSVTSGNSPLTVTFDGSGSTDADGIIAGYLWDFGDGATDDGDVVTHTFTATTQTTYTVTLTVTDDSGAKAEVTQTIEVLPPSTATGETDGTLQAVIEASALVGLTPLTVTFDAGESTAGDSAIIEYDWNFGDDETAIGETVTHTFEPESTSEFTVTLFVWTADGSLSTAQIDIIVIVPEGETGEEDPVADLAADDPDRIHYSTSKPNTPSLFEVTLDPGGSYADAGHQLLYFVWEFGDGTTLVEDEDVEVTHVYELYSLSHTYVARLTVYDDQGLEGSDTANITLSDEDAEEEEE